MIPPPLTPERLRELLSYDPLTGVFTWNVRRSQRAEAGAQAGSEKARGYVEIKIDGRLYKAHRLAFMWMTGEFPPEHVDHINGQKADNRWCNLRPATRSQNLCNQQQHRGSASGLKGAFWDAGKGRWFSAVRVRGSRFDLGYFDSAEDAHAAYCAAAKRLHGDYANFGSRAQSEPTASAATTR